MFKVSTATPVVCGLVGPKLRLKSVSDGEQVNIPVLFVFRYQLWSAEVENLSDRR
jgi:hypothetical protein